MKPTILPSQIRFGFSLLTLSLILNAFIGYENLQRIFNRSRQSYELLTLESLSIVLGLIINLVMLWLLYQWAGQQFQRQQTIEQSLKHRQTELSQHIQKCTDELEERLQAQQSLSQAITVERQHLEQLKDEFIAIVGHELKTPMTSIQGSLKILSSGLVDTHSEQGQHLLTIATDSADRLTCLINQIVELENNASGIGSQIVPCNVLNLLHESLEIQKSFASEHQVKLMLSPIPDRQLQVLADPQRLHHVIHHLLQNAIQFSPSDHRVTMTVQYHNNQVMFSIRDQGPGIAPEQLEGVFVRFHQLDHSIAKKHEGSGIGLFLCRKIIEAMRGQIWVESQLGQGSTFYFTLPCG